MRENLATLLHDFRRHGQQTAVVRHHGNRRRVSTHAQIAQLAGRFAALLAQREIGPGDRVLLWAENSAEWIAAFYGCMLRGVLAVPLDAYGSADFASRIARDVSPKLAVGDASLLVQLPKEFPHLSFEDWLAVLPNEEAKAIAGLSHETPLQILYTSGTTGDPKGIVLTHGNVLASIAPIEEGTQPYLRYERLVHPLRFLHTLPLSHVFGQTMGLWIPPIFAAEVHFESRLVAPRLIETIRRERISVLAAVPRVHALLQSHLQATFPALAEQIEKARSLRAWKRWWRFRQIHSTFGLKFWALISGGGALPRPVEEFWNALGFVVIQGYGMTETTALITLNHPFRAAKGSIGRPLPGREVKLGEDGEVLVRGAMISTATWSKGKLNQQSDAWLATGDLAETQPSGELRFLGRKSETIVTASGVNIHPEDLEAVLDQEPGVAASAVVPLATSYGPEACAVLVFRGPREQAATAIEHANDHLADFQQLRRWVLWPEPDLPRTTTGKVRRKEVSQWLASLQRDGGSKEALSSDWLLSLIAQITGEKPEGNSDELRLSEDLHLDSLGRVHLAAALEERLGMGSESGLLDEIKTLSQLRELADNEEYGSQGADPLPDDAKPDTAKDRATDSQDRELPPNPVYPSWPWSLPICWLRSIFVETVLRPLVWLLANPVVGALPQPIGEKPMLIVANHVTSFDGPLLQYALPGRLRRRMAVAMSAEMLNDFRHFRNPQHGPRQGRFDLFGPLAYLLLTALFNVFPLPRQRNFQASFTHAGKALDRGFSVLLFPEGTRSSEGTLAHFRPGIGLLVRQSGAPVLPMAIRGLGALKTGKRGWFRSGLIAVRVGSPIHFSGTESEASIATRLHDEVEKLLVT